MRHSPCRFLLPLTDNDGRPIDPEVIVHVQRELLAKFGGFTIHPTSQGRWRSREGRVYQEEIVVDGVAVPQDRVPELRDVVSRLGSRLGQLAMYFDAPPPSVDIIDLSGVPDPTGMVGGIRDEPRPRKTTRGRGKKDRPSG